MNDLNILIHNLTTDKFNDYAEQSGDRDSDVETVTLEETIFIVTDVIRKIIDKQDAFVQSIDEGDGIFSLTHKDWCKLNTLKPGTKLFLFPTKVNDLKNVR